MKYIIIIILVFFISCQSDCEEKLKNAYKTIATMEVGQESINNQVAGIIDNVKVLWKEESEFLGMVNSTPDDVIEKLDIINLAIKKANSKISKLRNLIDNSGFQDDKFIGLKNQLEKTLKELEDKQKQIKELKSKIKDSGVTTVYIEGYNAGKYTISYQGIIQELEQELDKVKGTLNEEKQLNENLINQYNQLDNEYIKKEEQLNITLQELEQAKLNATKKIKELKLKNKKTLDSLKRVLAKEKSIVYLDIARDLLSNLKNVKRRKRKEIVKTALFYYKEVQDSQCGINVDYEIQKIKSDYKKYLK